MDRIFRSLRKNNQGATAIEYGLLVGLIAIAAVGAMGTFGNRSGAMWDHVEAKITAE